MRSVDQENLRTAAGLALVSAAVPSLAGLSLLETAAWCGALLVGTALTPLGPLSATGLGWIAAVIVPGTPPASVASSATLAQSWIAVAAALIGAVFVLVLPPLWAQPGPLLIMAGLLTALLNSRSAD